MYAFAFFHPAAAKKNGLFAGEIPFGKDEKENEA